MTDLDFDQLYDRHVLEVYRYISRRHIGNDAQDLTGDVFLIAFQKLNSIPAGSELPWLYRTAWNVLANAHRKNEPIPANFDLTEIEQKILKSCERGEKLLEQAKKNCIDNYWHFGNSNQEVEYLKQIVNEYLDAKTIINKPLNEDVSGTNGIDEV